MGLSRARSSPGRSMPYRRHRKATQASPSKEGNFQSRVIQCARLNGWRVDVTAATDEDHPLYKHLHHWFRGKLAKARQFLFDRRKHDFLLVYHTHDSRRSAPGFPDLVLAHPDGRLIFAELKRDGQYPKTEQRLWLSALSRVAEENPLVEVFLWRPSDWENIVHSLGGVDSRLFL